MSKEIKLLSVEDFSIIKNKPQAVFIFTDWEPDDIQHVIALVRLCHTSNIKIVIISGGGNNEIQNERAKKYILTLLSNDISRKWLKTNVQFFKGASSKDLPGLGSDVLSVEELREISKRPHDSKPESAAIKKALASYPQSMVFCIKKPEELVGDDELLALVSKSTLITYTGGFNYASPELKSVGKDASSEEKQQIEEENALIRKSHQEGIRQLFNAFQKVGIVQNYHMLQNADFKDPTPRDIMPEHTPKFAKLLKEDNSPLGLAIKRSIRVWNEKTIFDIQKKAHKFSTDKGEDHAKGTKQLKEIFARKPLELNNITLHQIKEAVKLLDDSDPEIKFRKKMWLNVINNMEVQCVLADQLAAFAVCNPDLFSNPGTPGTLNFTKDGFIEVQASADSKEARCLCFPAITGTAGKPLDGGTRIVNIDDFLCKMVIGSKLHLGSAHRLVGGKIPAQPLITKSNVEAKLSRLIKKQNSLNKPIHWEITTQEGQSYAKMTPFIQARDKGWFQTTLQDFTISFAEEPKGLALIIHHVDASSFASPSASLAL